MIEFEAWPKTPRLQKPAIYTEKIDGTNGAVVIREVDHETPGFQEMHDGMTLQDGTVKLVDCESGEMFAVAAQSRKRLISPQDDNFGFARWVHENAHALVEVLGEGRHFGEWWGSGIQRGYGLKNGEKYFSLFNVSRWNEKDEDTDQLLPHGKAELAKVPQLRTVPLLATTETFDTEHVNWILSLLESEGSQAVDHLWDAEGVIVYHTASGQVYKAFCNDDPKS